MTAALPPSYTGYFSTAPAYHTSLENTVEMSLQVLVIASAVKH